MIPLLERIDLDKTYQFLLVILAFLMPVTVFGANTIIVFICFIWLFSGNYKSKFHQIRNNKLMLASIAFFTLHVVGLAWTEDLSWGLHIVHKMWYFLLLFPILYTIVSRKYIKHYLSSFLLAISITEILSYLVWFEVISPFKNATVYNPTPFMSHISYNPILAFAIYLIGHEILFNSKINAFKRYAYSFFMITMSINMFITGGRAGQVMFFAVLSILIFQYFNYQKIKSLVAILIVTSSVFFTAYQTSDIFHLRANNAISEILHYGTLELTEAAKEAGAQNNKNTSVGQRITYTLNSWEVIMKNPIIGIGTGDFPTEYTKVHTKNTPEVNNTAQPHNMYILVLMQLGLIGLISFLLIFYYQIKLSFLSKNKFIRDVGIALPLLFLLIMWSDSYLLGHYTSLMYIFFSSFLYKDFEKS
jgi:O-antigen ligase